jgi:tetratricopeptide (TPR) repeat protein
VLFETDLGEIGPEAQMVTDSEGRAEVLLTSTKIGPASVRVRMEGQERLLSATQVVFEAASPASITLTVGSEVAAADGESECLLHAEVRDEMGNPVPGKNVEFKTDVGSLVPSSTRLTDKDGIAEVQCISREAGRAKIIATCDQATSEIEVAFEAGKASSIAMSLNPTVEEGWRNRLPEDHWNKLKEALRHLEERRFSEAIDLLEAEESKIAEVCDYPAQCDLAFAYQQSGRVDDAERIYRSIINRNGSRREIRVKADGIEETFGVVLPKVNGGDDDLEYIKLKPRDYLINVVVTDSHGNHISDLDVEFSANFGWVPDDFKHSKTNVVGASSSLVTTFSPPGSSEVEFAWVNLGKMKENTLDYAGAEECYRSAIKSMPESTRGLEALASVLVKIGNSNNAKKCYFNLASTYSKRGQLNKALEYYGKAIELDPKYARALAGYGAACLKVGELDRARRYLEESVRVDKTLKASLTNLGLVYYLTGRFDDAIKSNRRALKLDPAYKSALLNMHQIHTARGERDKAVEFATKIKALG